MKPKKLLLFIGIPAVLILLLFLLNLFVKQKVKDRLEGLDADINYETLDVNIYSNRYELEELQTQQGSFSVAAKNVIIKGISYSKLLFDGSLEIDELEVLGPEITYYKGKTGSEKDSSGREVKIGEIHLQNGNFSSKENDTADASLFVSFPEVKLTPGEKGISNFQPESYRVKLDSVYLKMNAEHYIDVGGVEAENGSVQVSDFRIASFYSKREFDQKIPYEKDHISLNIPSISLEDLNIQQLNDTLHIGNSKIVISEAFLEIYRNKLLPDDTRRKPLYNELLREAPVKLNLEQVLVEKSEIIYEERVQEGREAGVIRFSGVEGEIKNLNNLRDSLQQPQVSASANFMRGTYVTLDWTFQVFDEINPFQASGSFGEIEGAALDPFIIPVMDAQVRGTINDISFNFFGNDDFLKGDFVIDYESLKVELLKNEGTETKDFLSALANLLVENEGEAGNQETDIKVDRNKQRSFWNFMWLGLRKGFIETVEQF